MYLKLQSAACLVHKQEHRIMQVLKYGRINHMILKVIYGPSDVLFMKLELCNRLLEQIVWKICIGMFCVADLNGCLVTAFQTI